MYNLWILWAMIYIPSWTTKKHKKNSFQATTFKAEKNSRTFEDCVNPVWVLSSVVWILFEILHLAIGSVHNTKKQLETESTIGDRIVETLYSNRVISEDKRMHNPPPPLHTKLGCLLFSAGSSNSGTNIAWRGWGRKSFTVPLSLKSVTRQKASLG